MGTYFVAEIEMVTEECYKCGVLFAITAELQNARVKDHEFFYCPNGHAQYYPGQTEEERLKQLLDDERQCCISAREEANAIERRLIATKGVVTKLKNSLNNK